MKRILITGAGTGFGRETAITLAKRGHHVYAATYDQHQSEALADYADLKGVNLDILKIDITDINDIKKAKNLDVDVLINNAAIGESGALVEIPIDRVRNNLETNVLGTLSMIQAVTPKMMKRKNGTIIMVTSLAGRVPLPFLSPYSMSKYALESAGAGLAEELKPFNIHVSMIEPGPYSTGFNEANMNKKYNWMKEDSLYRDKIDYIKKTENRLILRMQKSNFTPVIKAMVKAAESNKPKLRYAVPKWMGLGVNLLRGFGV
ncbi:MAG: SDR family oxidoreductase [Bermanella sp.]